MKQPTMDTLVSSEWLAAHLDDPELVVLDCSVRTVMGEGSGWNNVSGREDYRAGHIPGAGFADLMGDLSDTAEPIEFALPNPEHFCAVMGALGVGDDSRVVLYDGFMSMWAARVWWMLRWVGFDRAALLDGGLQVWKAQGRPISTEPVERAAKTLTPSLRPQLIADRDEVFASIGAEGVCLIDTFPEEHFRGEQSMYARPGHIPGATNLYAMALFDETGRFRPLEELATLHTSDKETRTITYCGGGIMASASAFVMTRLGYTDVAVYTASLQEWAADPANPMALGAA
ncbi:MAG: sulfurtransferase [Trueperaceae bacterium]|nr:MAG: sulfurtransferase [Trueperaceae bacterium]